MIFVDSKRPPFEWEVEDRKRNRWRVSAIAAYHHALALKYEQAATRPWQRIPADPPFPLADWYMDPGAKYLLFPEIDRATLRSMIVFGPGENASRSEN
jgi:hypothetical protein